MNIKKDDKVIVLSGKDKGKEGKVLVADPKNNKVVVEGVVCVFIDSEAATADSYIDCLFHVVCIL